MKGSRELRAMRRAGLLATERGKGMDRISPSEYAQAVVACLRLARQPTGGGQVAAQVLLSAYNGFSFQLDVAGLGSLDRNNYEIALTVIRGRYDTGIEPHNVVEGGGRIFRDLWAQWEGLELVQRAKRQCSGCEDS